jgi:mannose-6-phosphate isomerase-like protein (cupin superfamily)
MIERVVSAGRELAIIIRSSYRSDGITFFTPAEYSQQLGYMRRPAGYTIQPHVHNAVPREVTHTKEVLFIRSGRVEVYFFTDEKEFLETRILEAGDVILLAFGGHGFRILEDAEIIEVKQGPYCAEADKTRFDGIPAAPAPGARAPGASRKA